MTSEYSDSRVVSSEEVLQIFPQQHLLGEPFEMRNMQPHSYIIPSFDPTQISDLLEEQFRGEGGTIENTGLYINPSSASRWGMVANQAGYTSVHAGVTYDDIARHIHHYYLQKTRVLDIFALGCGDGKSETRLTQHLVSYVPETNLLLLDVSQPLLNRAYSYALSVLGPAHRKNVYTILGNMHHLSQASYSKLYNPQPKSSRRLITMFGCTFGNLERELNFVRDSLSGFAVGDLFLVDLVLPFAPTDKEEEIKEKDPRLANKNPPGWDSAYENFFSSVIRSYCQGIKSIEYHQELDNTCCQVPGSYAIAMRSKVHFYEGRDKMYTMYIYKRHDVNKLVDAMNGAGWKASTGWRYGRNNMLYLFEKYK